VKILRVVVSAADVERAAEAFYRAGSLGGQEELRREGVVFVAAFATPPSAQLALRMLEAAGIASRLESPEDPADPIAEFRAGLSPFSIGPFRIDPREACGGMEEPDGIFLHVPASVAFGTGLHESTRGILRWLGRHDVAGRRVLDVGCGTAILAIAAVKRGAARATAFDVDLDAVFEARRNLFRNWATGAVRLVAGPLASIGGVFDVVLANMIWEEVEPLVPGLAARLAPGGTAVFSGILDEREAVAEAGLTAAGFRIANVESDDEWRTITVFSATGDSPG
jgi:ribosomal protein L11 methyltransferase